MSRTPSLFRLRRNGQIFGPYANTQIRLMAQRGEIALTDELSLNGGQWVLVMGTPLAREIPKKPAITLREPRKPLSAEKTAVAMPGVFDPKGPVQFGAPRPAPAPVVAQPPVPPAAQEEEDDPLKDWGFEEDSSAKTARRPGRPPRRAPRHSPRRSHSSSGGFSTEVVMGILAVVLLVGVIVIAILVARSHTPPTITPEVIPSAANPAPTPEKPKIKSAS